MACDNCKKEIEAGRFINVNGGALLMDWADDSGGPDNRLSSFLYINTHDDTKELYKCTTVTADKKDSGQFEWYFCNKKCMKQFFMKIFDKVDDIE